jgi:hypothetical protein
VICLTDEDIIKVDMETLCTEGGCYMAGADDNLVYLEYQVTHFPSPRINTSPKWEQPSYPLEAR